MKIEQPAAIILDLSAEESLMMSSSVNPPHVKRDRALKIDKYVLCGHKENECWRLLNDSTEMLI